MAFAGGGLNTPSARETAPGRQVLRLCRAVAGADVLRPARRLERPHPLRAAGRRLSHPGHRGFAAAGWHSATARCSAPAPACARRTRRCSSRERELSLRTDALRGPGAGKRAAARTAPAACRRWCRRALLADVINADLGRLRQRLVINRGDRAGLFRSQAVVDADRPGRPAGARRPVERRGHADHRSGGRGAGARSCAAACAPLRWVPAMQRELRLPYLPATADVKAGDLLVTSGLGGVFPAGIPVGEVTKSERDPDESAGARARQAQRATGPHRQVLALWFDPSNPAAPRRPEMLNTLPPATVADPVTREPAPPKPAGAQPPAAPSRPRRTPQPRRRRAAPRHPPGGAGTGAQEPAQPDPRTEARTEPAQ